jgi:hypothetical protein
MIFRLDLEPGAIVQEYTFYSKPLGLYEEWHTQQKFISVSAENPENDFWVPEADDFTHFGPLQVVPKEQDVEIFRASTKRMT